MYGVPADLDLSRFIGATLEQVALGNFQIQFHFHPEGNISVEGRWELRDASGRLIDQEEPTANRDAYRVHQLLGCEVTGWQLDPPYSITLEFNSGHRLQIFDSSSVFESFSIQPGDIFI